MSASYHLPAATRPRALAAHLQRRLPSCTPALLLRVLQSARAEQAGHRGLLGNVKPGGWIQLVDGDLWGFDGAAEGFPAMGRLMAFIEMAFAQGGMNAMPGRSLREWLEDAGAEQVEAKRLQFGMGRKAELDKKAVDTVANVMGMINNFAAIWVE